MNNFSIFLNFSLKERIFPLLFILLFSCQTKENVKTVFESKEETPYEKADSLKNSLAEQEKSDFELFIDKFNKDCDYQKECVQFPLPVIHEEDYDGENYDTTYLSKKEYDCMEFTSPKSNIIEGKVTLDVISKSKLEKIIQLGVDETGVHIEYFFTFKEKRWFLYKILDEST